VTSRPISDPVTMDDCMFTFDTPTASLRQATYGFRQLGNGEKGKVEGEEGGVVVEGGLRASYEG
jgi:hypothetical protein